MISTNSSTAPTAPPPYEPVKPPIESTYVTIENQNMGHMEVPQVVVLAESLGPPQLPPLTRGEQIRRVNFFLSFKFLLRINHDSYSFKNITGPLIGNCE